jgi:hypothetical protein
MRLYAGRITAIAEDMIRTLRDSGAIDVVPESLPEAQLDVEAVLREYVRMDRDLTSRARQLSEEGRGSFGRIKRRLARESGFKLGDEAIDYVVNQLIETFLHSNNIEEVYVEDRELRLQMSPIIKKHTRDMGEELDQDVRKRIRNLEEGSVAWETEYERVMKQLKRQRKLD